MNRLAKFLQIKDTTKVFGMVHVKALPGTPNNRLTTERIVDHALEEADLLSKCQVDGIVVENMHDLPYCQARDVGPEITSAMTTICNQMRRGHPNIPLGVQILAGANKQALAVALASDFDFIRAECFVFSHVADEGWMDASAGPLLRYRRSIGADHISIITDLKKKHSAHSVTSDVSLVETAQAAEFFLADGVIVTGNSTGVAASAQDVEDVKQAVSIPVFVGSGVTADNVEKFSQADGLIVGSYFKKDGQWNNAIDESKVKDLMSKIQKL